MRRTKTAVAAVLKKLDADPFAELVKLARETADGRIENAYQLQVMNLSEAAQHYQVSLDGESPLEIVGERSITVDAGSILPLQLTLSAGAEALPPGSHPVVFHVVSGTMQARESSTFRMP